MLAEVGHQVVCVDIDADKVERLNQGLVPIFEPGLESCQRKPPGASLTTDAAGLHQAIQMIAVGTPPGEDGSAISNMCWPSPGHWSGDGRAQDRRRQIDRASRHLQIMARIADTLKAQGREDLSFDVGIRSFSRKARLWPTA